MAEFHRPIARSRYIRVAREEQDEQLRQLVEMSRHVRARCAQVLHRSTLARASAQRALNRADRRRLDLVGQLGRAPSRQVR